MHFVDQRDQVYSNKRAPTQVSKNQQESYTNQHESDTSQHESTQVQHMSTRMNTSPTRVNTSQLDHEIIIVYLILVSKV